MKTRTLKSIGTAIMFFMATSVLAATPSSGISIVPHSPFIGPQVGSGQSAERPYDTSRNLAYQGNGYAKPAVALDTIIGYPQFHQPQFVNDGLYGNGASWIPEFGQSWIKIDLGRQVTIDTLKFGRDRLGYFNDRNPGRFIIQTAVTDNVYANGDESNDAAEYTTVLDSDDHGFSGIINGPETVGAFFEPVVARYVKLNVFSTSADRAAIDDIEVAATSSDTVSLFLDPSPFSGSESLIEFDGVGPSSSEIPDIDGVSFSLLELNTLTDTGFRPRFASAPNTTYAREFPPTDGPFFLNMINPNAPFYTDLKIDFPFQINRVAAEIRSGQTINDVDDLSFEFYSVGTLIGQSTQAIRGQNDFFFYGFESTVPFDQLVIRQRPDARFGLENLRFELGEVSPIRLLESLGDINGDSTQDIAALVHDAAAGTLIATVKDVNNSLIGNVAFDGSLTPLRFIKMPDINSNGAPELVVLGTGSVKAEVRDSLTGNLLSTINYNPNVTPVDIGVVPDQDGNGIPELAVLGKHPSKGFVNVQTRDALTGNLVMNTGFVPTYIPTQMLVLPDVDSNGLPEFAVLAVEDSAEQFIKVEIRNINGALVRDIWLDQVSPDPLYMVMLKDMNGNGAVELATLRQKKDWTNVVVNDALSGAKLSSIGYNPNFEPLKLVVMPDLNGNGKQELAMFGKNINTDGIKAEVRDASSGALIKDVFFWKVFTPQDLVTLPDISGNGKAELAMLGLRLSDGALRAYIKDVVTNTDIINVRF